MSDPTTRHDPADRATEDGPIDGAPTDGRPVPRIFAHRAFAGIAPENTLSAVETAVAHGADAIEIDVVATADGTPVVFHDEHLDRRGTSRGITDRTGAVHDRSTEYVTAARVLDTDATVPTLAAVVAAVPDRVGLNVELKRPPSGIVVEGPLDDARRAERREDWAPFVGTVRDVLDAFGGDLLVSSFDEGALAAALALDADLAVAPLAIHLDDALAMAQGVGAGTVHPSIASLRAAGDAPGGYTVNAWTATTWVDARDAVACGADGVIAEYPGLVWG